MYASVHYAELVRLYKNDPIEPDSTYPTQLVVRDLYTFGSPRLVLEDFVNVFAAAMEQHRGQSWRIVSAHDPVTAVPPVLITDPTFVHIDKGYTISDHKPPEEMESERYTHPRPQLPVIAANMSFHSR